MIIVSEMMFLLKIWVSLFIFSGIGEAAAPQAQKNEQGVVNLDDIANYLARHPNSWPSSSLVTLEDEGRKAAAMLIEIEKDKQKKAKQIENEKRRAYLRSILGEFTLTDKSQ